MGRRQRHFSQPGLLPHDVEAANQLMGGRTKNFIDKAKPIIWDIK